MHVYVRVTHRSISLFVEPARVLHLGDPLLQRSRHVHKLGAGGEEVDPVVKSFDKGPSIDQHVLQYELARITLRQGVTRLQTHRANKMTYRVNIKRRRGQTLNGAEGKH